MNSGPPMSKQAYQTPLVPRLRSGGPSASSVKGPAAGDGKAVGRHYCNEMRRLLRDGGALPLSPRHPPDHIAYVVRH